MAKFSTTSDDRVERGKRLLLEICGAPKDTPLKRIKRHGRPLFLACAAALLAAAICSGMIFTLEPIRSAGAWEIAALYGAYFAVGMALLVPVNWVFKSERKDIPKLWEILILVPVEDGLFRAIPMVFFGGPGLVAAHFAWAFAHRLPPTVVFALANGLLELRLWLGGMWMTAIALHIVHDFWLLAVYRGYKRRNAKSAQGESK